MKRISFAALILAVLGGGAVAAAASNEAGVATPAPGEQEQAEIERTRAAFLDDKVAPTIKPSSYDVTVVEYTDYQCPFCRASHEALLKLATADRKVRIIYRDWPIFGAQSERAARLAIASQWQGKHAEFHDALMKAPRPLTEEAIRAAARKAGVDWMKLEADLKARGADVDALLERNDEQAMALGLDGTPGFIIGDKLYAGGLDLTMLRQAVADARSAKPGRIVPLKPEGI